MSNKYILPQIVKTSDIIVVDVLISGDDHGEAQPHANPDPDGNHLKKGGSESIFSRKSAALIESPRHQLSKVGDPCDPELSVPVSHEAGVSTVADGLILGDTQPDETSASDKVGGELLSLRKSAKSHSPSLRSQNVSPIAEARPGLEIPRSHGADSLVSRVGIITDGPFYVSQTRSSNGGKRDS